MALQETLDAFVKSGKKGDLGELMMVLHEIARTGETSYNWPSVRSLLSTQLQNVIDSYSKISPKIVDVDGESFETRYTRVQKYLSDFSRPPFTLQRMAELLVMPRRYYTTGAKFFLAFSKLVCGISARNFEEENRDSPSEVDSKSGMGFDEVVRPPFLEAKVDIDLPIEARALSRLPPGGAQLAQSGGSAGGPAAGGSSGDAPKTVQASESVKPEKSEAVAPVSSSVSASASPAATPSSVSSASSVSSSLIDDNDLNMIS